MKRNNFFALIVVCGFFAACSKDKITNLTTADVNNTADIYPAPPAKWFGGANPYFSAAGFVGDVMPYYDKDSFHVFYLHDARNGAAGFHPWSKFTTTNFTNYNYNGVMIPYGGTTDYDLALGTGSIVKVNNIYYAYYSGFNNNFNGTGGKFRDNTLLATSNDLNNWKKVPGFIIKPETTNGYNQWEYRDPYVFFNTETNEYWMLVCGRKDDKAAVMLYTTTTPASNNWQLKNPVYTTGDYNVPETPQMFKWGNYWYLIFSENSVENTTRYRISSSSLGPWATPANDKLDGQYQYASKVASNGTNTYLFGWCPTKGGSSDGGGRDFGGNLVVHKLTQNTDGTINVTVPENVEKSFTKNQSLNLALKEQSIGFETNNVSFKSTTSDALLVFERIAGGHMITATISDVQAGAEFGFAFGLDKAALNPNYYKINFSETNNMLSGLSVRSNTPHTDGKVNLNIEPGKEYQLKIIISGSIAVIYIDNKVALTSRIYSINNNFWGLYASKGNVQFKNIQLFGL